MTVRDVGDIILYLGAVATALVAIGALLRWVIVRPLKSWITEQISPVKQSTAAVQETADKVHAEVSPDHGRSLKDHVVRTEAKVDTLTKRFDDHLINHPKG